PTGSLPDYTVFEGSLAYDSTLNVIKWYDGADWLPLGGISAAANGIDASTGTAKLGGVLTEETIIDLDGFVFGFKNPDTSDYLKFKTTSGPTIEIEMDGSGTHFGYGSIR